ncbi:MAG: NAD(P)/FAD-dependent oxidoreductase [Chitinophagaceae bacterium]|jgi:D-amino-acid dehydrogenase
MGKIVVAGGGIIGMCCAYYLNKAGYEVAVIDRGSMTEGTSYGNAGYICPSHFIPLASPGIVAKGLQWMLSSSSPFYIRPRLDLDLIRWGLTFWKRSGKSTMNKNIPHLHNILQLSRTLTSELRNELGDHFQMKEMGCLMLYKSSTTEHHEIEQALEAAALHIETRILSAKEVQAMEPDVRVDVRGGVLYPFDAHVHPGDLMQVLHRHLVSNGVEFHLNTSITGMETAGSKVKRVLTNTGDFACGQLVLAAGSWMPELTKMLGFNLLMQAGKGYSMTFENVNRNLRYPSILVDDRVAMTPLGNDLRMGGTMEISGLDSPLLIKRAEAIFKAARSYFPDLPVQFPQKEKIWFGWRPLSTDGLPYIGRVSRYSNLVLAGGHGMLGISLAAGTGKLIEEIVGGHPTTIPIHAFDTER